MANSLKVVLGSALALALVFGTVQFVAAKSIAAPLPADYQSVLQRLQAQIKELETMILQLKDKLAGLKLNLKVKVKDETPKSGEKDKEKLGDIFKLQVMLKETGHLSAVPTGYYGDLTRKAVENFQRATDIAPVSGYGVADKQTIAALDKAVEAKKPSDLRQEQPITSPKECKGDTNRNGIVNNFDIDSYREFYEKNKNSTITVYDPLFWFADINDNNVLDQIDIDLFTEILVGTRVPECRNVTN